MTTEMKVHRSKTLKCFFKCFSGVFQVFFLLNTVRKREITAFVLFICRSGNKEDIKRTRQNAHTNCCEEFLNFTLSK